MTKKRKRGRGTQDKFADSTVRKHFTDGTDSPIRKLHLVRRFINRTDSPIGKRHRFIYLETSATAPIRRLAKFTGSLITSPNATAALRDGGAMKDASEGRLVSKQRGRRRSDQDEPCTRTIISA
jgi:hypothetical protein